MFSMGKLTLPARLDDENGSHHVSRLNGQSKSHINSSVCDNSVTKSKLENYWNTSLKMSLRIKRMAVHPGVQYKGSRYCTIQPHKFIHCTIQSKRLAYCTIQSHSTVQSHRLDSWIVLYSTVLYSTARPDDLISRSVKSTNNPYKYLGEEI